MQSFDDLIAIGSKQDVLAFLQSENLNSAAKNFSFEKILHLLKDADFFEQTIKILRQRVVFNPKVWQYAFYHKSDVTLMSECIKLNKAQDCFRDLGTHFESKLVKLSAANARDGFTRCLEYHPLVNPRAHKIGKAQTHQILDATFEETFCEFLLTTAEKRSLSFDDKMMLVYYLQLQDRVKEAISLF